ncbi:MAG: hypothetical protein GXY44_05125 [Phycisphaerales bacterium]|nr:hypothetical protein [Phycisphaerales bacterium]
MRREVLHCILICIITLPIAAADAPSISGFVDDAYWSTQARVWSIYESAEDHPAARFWLGHDEQYLYVAADVNDPNVVGMQSGRKSEIWQDDSVEIFLDFGPGDDRERTPETFSFGFSAAGGSGWTRGTGDGSGDNYPAYDWPPPWDSAMSWAVRLKVGTTLNFSGDLDQGYMIEARIPWSELGQSAPFDPQRTIGVCFLNIRQSGNPDVETRVLSSVPGVELSNKHNPSLWQRIRLDMNRPLPIRGMVADLPLWLGMDGDLDRWEKYAELEDAPEGKWLDRSQWIAELDYLRKHKYNALLLEHPHPFTGLLALKDFPGAAHFSAAQGAKHRAQFSWLLAEARERGVEVYLSFQNICLPARWTGDKQLEELGADTPAARAYLRGAIKELFNTYPTLAGVATEAGPWPAGCTDFVIESIVGGLKDIARSTKTGPVLLLHTWGIYPEDAARIVEAWPRTCLLHEINGRQWFLPAVDQRGPRFAYRVNELLAERTVSPVPLLGIGGPESACAYMYWGDPEWMRNLCQDVRRQGMDGLFFRADSAEPRFAQAAMGYYAHAVDATYNRRFWEGQLHNMYGVGTHAGQLLDAVQSASGIIPILSTLLHGQSPRFMPQFGLPLTHYVEMPSISSFVADRCVVRDPQGYLIPRIGPTWANPDWGLNLAMIRDDVERTAALNAVSPQIVAEQILRHTETCRARLEGLRRFQAPNQDQNEALERLLSRLELNTALGEHYAYKIAAAIGWENYRTYRGRQLGCLEPLQQSVRAWERATAAAESLYQDPLPAWESRLVSAPPWSAEQLWQSYQPAHLHWSQQRARFEREFQLVQRTMAELGPRGPLPLWDQIDAWSRDQMHTVHLILFENAADSRYLLGPGAALTRVAGQVLEGHVSLLIDTRELEGDGWHLGMITNSAQAPLLPYRPYQITLSYAVLDGGSEGEPAFAIGLRPADGGEDIGENRYWAAPTGYRDRRVLQYGALDRDDYSFFIKVRGRAAILIDELYIDTPK